MSVMVNKSLGGTLREERDTNQCAPFVEIVAAQADRHDIETFDIAQNLVVPTWHGSGPNECDARSLLWPRVWPRGASVPSSIHRRL